jgi:uncharacterized protein YbjT (DUF2867 family)
MTTAVIGGTGRVGSEIVRGMLARGDAVAALLRDPGKGHRAFGEPDGLHIRPTRLDDPRDLTDALDEIRTVFIAIGSIGTEAAAPAPSAPPRPHRPALAGPAWAGPPDTRPTRGHTAEGAGDEEAIDCLAIFCVSGAASADLVQFGVIGA